MRKVDFEINEIVVNFIIIEINFIFFFFTGLYLLKLLKSNEVLS